MKWREGFDSSRLRGRPLVVGAPSIGGVGQLAAESCVASLRLPRVATHCGDGLAPLVGNAGRDGLCAPCELYSDPDSPFDVLLLRSPVSSHRVNAFLDTLNDIITTGECSAVIILSGLPATERREASESFGYVADGRSDSLPSLDSLEALPFVANEHRHSGFAARLFEDCVRRRTPCLALFKYCYEGDNVSDATELVSKLNKFIRFLPDPERGIERICIPSSWKFPFGNRPPANIY